MDGSSVAERTTIVVQSGDMDKLYSSLIIANGALAMGMEVTLFFTFWGLLRLKKGGLDQGGLSRMNFLGLGRWMMRRRMHKANVVSLSRLVRDFHELGGKIIACEMTMEIMGIGKDDLDTTLIDEFGAVGSYIHEARKSAVTLFI